MGISEPYRLGSDRTDVQSDLKSIPFAFKQDYELKSFCRVGSVYETCAQAVAVRSPAQPITFRALVIIIAGHCFEDGYVGKVATGLEKQCSKCEVLV